MALLADVFPECLDRNLEVTPANTAQLSSALQPPSEHDWTGFILKTNQDRECFSEFNFVNVKLHEACVTMSKQAGGACLN